MFSSVDRSGCFTKANWKKWRLGQTCSDGCSSGGSYANPTCNPFTRVDFNDERTCFEDVAQCLARYFCSLPFKKEAKGNGSGSSDGNATNSKRNNNNNNEEDDNDDRKTLKWFIQHILLPSCRSRYYPRREFATDGTILQIAALEDLYRQFER